MSRRHAWAKVADLQDAEDVDALVAMFNNPDYFPQRRLRSHILSVLGRLRAPSAADAIVTVLLTEDESVLKVDATWALANVASERHIEVLVDALKQQEDFRIRMHAARGLGRFSSDASVDALIAALGDPEKGVRWQAADSLGQIGRREAIEPLMRVLQDPSWSARVCASEALARLHAEMALPALRHARNRTPPPWRFRLSHDIKALEKFSA